MECWYRFKISYIDTPSDVPEDNMSANELEASSTATAIQHLSPQPRAADDESKTAIYTRIREGLERVEREYSGHNPITSHQPLFAVPVETSTQ